MFSVLPQDHSNYGLSRESRPACIVDHAIQNACKKNDGSEEQRGILKRKYINVLTPPLVKHIEDNWQYLNGKDDVILTRALARELRDMIVKVHCWNLFPNPDYKICDAVQFTYVERLKSVVDSMVELYLDKKIVKM